MTITHPATATRGATSPGAARPDTDHGARNLELWRAQRDAEARAAAATTPAQARRARRAVERCETEALEANDGMVAAIVRPFRSLERSHDDEDLAQAGRLALLEAWRSWDPERGPLAGWAWVRIDGAVRRQVATNEELGSYHDFCRRPMVAAAVAALTEELGREPTDEEVAASTGHGVDAVRRSRRQSAVSLDAPIGDGEHTVGGLIVEAASVSGDGDEWDALEHLAADLPADQLALLVRCCGTDGVALDGGPRQSLRAAGVMLGINHDGACTRLSRARAAIGE